jgi:hypothetical protein
VYPDGAVVVATVITVLVASALAGMASVTPACATVPPGVPTA